MSLEVLACMREGRNVICISQRCERSAEGVTNCKRHVGVCGFVVELYLQIIDEHIEEKCGQVVALSNPL